MDGDDLRNRLRGNYSLPQTRPSPPTTVAPVKNDSLLVNSSVKRTKRHFNTLAAVLTIALIAAGGAGSLWYYLKPEKSPVPASVKSAVSLPVYYPDKLPAGFNLDDSSYSVNNGIVSYFAVNEANKKLVFTVQPRPPTFDYQTFYQKGLSGTEQFLVPAGQAAIGRAQTKLIGNLVTDTTWVIVSSDSDKLNSDDFKLVLKNLKSPSGT